MDSLLREPVNALTHGVWGLLCIPAALWLVWKSRGSLLKMLSCLVFGASLVACFFGSCLYHGIHGSDEAISFCEMLDHVGIYLLIAGTGTPVILVLLRGASRWGTLAIIWSMALAGIILRVSGVLLPDGVSTTIYVLMGWTGLMVYCQLARQVSHRALVWMWGGGLIYSIGAVMKACGWPRLFPGVFDTHELWHLMVIAGSFCHLAFMVRVVAPFQRQPAAPGELLDSTEASDGPVSPRISTALDAAVAGG